MTILLEVVKVDEAPLAACDGADGRAAKVEVEAKMTVLTVPTAPVSNVEVLECDASESYFARVDEA